MSDLDSEDSGDGSGDSEDMPTSFVFFGIAMLMVGLSPFVFLISAMFHRLFLHQVNHRKLWGFYIWDMQ